MRLKRQAVLLREGAGEALRLDRAHVGEHVGQLLAGLFALARLFEVLRRNPGTIEQYILESFTRGRHFWAESRSNRFVYPFPQAGLPGSPAYEKESSPRFRYVATRRSTTAHYG